MSLAPITIETAQFIDANTESLTLIPSVADIAQFVDSATESLGLTPSGSDVAQFVELTPVADESNQPTITSNFSFGLLSGGIKIAQSFIAPGNYSIVSIETWLDHSGPVSDQVLIELYNDNSNKPGSSVAQISPITIAATTPTRTLTALTSPYLLTSGARYWIVFSRTGALDDLNNYEAGGRTNNPYANGNYSAFDTNWFAQASWDINFIIHFAPLGITVPLSFSPSSTEEHTTYDVATESLLVVPSSADVADFVDQNTATSKLTPTASLFGVYKDPAGTIDITALRDFINTIGRSWSDSTLFAQSFIPDTDGALSSVELFLQKISSPTDNVVIEIRTDNSNQPSSTVLSSRSIPASLLSTVGPPVDPTIISFGNTIQLTGGTRYWIVFYRSVPNSTGSFATYGTDIIDSRDFYTSGKFMRSFGTWADDTLIKDLFFAIRFWNVPTDIQLAFNPSSTDTAQFVDQNTEALPLVPSSSDTAQFIDSNTESLLLQASASEEHAVYDADMEILALAPSSTDTAQFVDSDMESLILAPITTQEGKEYADADSERLALTGDSADSANFQDASTESLSLAPTADDISQFSDAASEILAVSPSDQQNFQGAESDTERVSLAPSSLDTAGYVDSNIEIFVILPSGSDTYLPGAPGITYTDANTESLGLAPSSDELYAHTFFDLATEDFTLGPSSSDLVEDIDATTAIISSSPLSSDITEFIDAAAKRLAFEILYSDAIGHEDSNTSTIELDPLADEEHIISDAAQEVLLLSSPNTVEYTDFVDSNALYLKLIPKPFEIYKLYELVGVAFQRFQAIATELRFSGIAARRFWSKVQEARWSATVPFRRWWFKSRM